MKRFLFLAMMACVVLTVAADRFYIEDFSVTPGRTVLVSLILDNDVQYTAFQADVYLPEELSVNNDNGVYGFSLTDRKVNHLLSASRLPDGGIRLLSYSVDLQPYSNNDGPLLTVPITASDDFEGSVVIELKKVLFTTMTAREVALPGETCYVTAAVSPLGDVNDDGVVNVNDVITLIDYLLGTDVEPFNETNADLDANGMISIKDATVLIDLLLNLN